MTLILFAPTMSDPEVGEKKEETFYDAYLDPRASTFFAFSDQGPVSRKSRNFTGPFSGVTIPSVSQERRGFKSSNFTLSLLFVTLKTY